MSGGLNIPKMPADHGKLKMPTHDVEGALFDLRKSWKDLPLSAIESEYGYVHHSRRMVFLRPREGEHPRVVTAAAAVIRCGLAARRTVLGPTRL